MGFELINNYRTKILNIQKDKRLKAIGLTSFANGITRIVQIVTGIIMVPLTLNYLGEERYGLMMTIVSFLGLVSFADLGMGMGVQNKIPGLMVQKKTEELKDLISGVFFLLVFIIILLLLAFGITFPFMNWDEFFNIKTHLHQNEAANSVLVFFLCFVIAIPFGLVQRIQDGFQEGYLNQIWLSISTLIGFILVYISIKLNYKLPILIFAIYGTNTLFIIFNFLFHFTRLRPEFLPKFKKIDLEFYKTLFWGGLAFFILQVTNLVFQSADPILIAKTLNIKEVTMYVIGFKLLNLMILPIQILVPAFLPAFNEAIAKNDYFWIKKMIYSKVKIIVFFSIITSLITYYFSNDLIHLWINNKTNLSLNFKFALCFYIFFLNFNLLFSYIGLTSLFVRKTSIYYLVAVIATIILKYYFLPILGLPGTVWVTISCFMIFYFLPLFFLFRKHKII